MDRELDVFTNYRMITGKIKKRFLKKPNYAEASEQFGMLTRVLKRQECPQYAGFCCLAKARCENTVGNSVGEVEALLEAARLFYQAEKANVDKKCPALEEHISESIHCYNQAVKAHIKDGHPSLATIVALELSNNLVEIGKLDEAFSHFVLASEIQRENGGSIDYALTLKSAALCKMYTDELQTALKYFGQVADILEGLVKSGASTYSVRALRENTEITRVFLLLLLRSSRDACTQTMERVMEKYTWENRDEEDVLPDELFLLIQSVVMATQAGDIEMLEELENEMFDILDKDQLELLHRIVKSGAGS